MKIKKFTAAILSICLCGAFMPLCSPDYLAASIAADEEEEYTTGTYGDLTYQKYSDHVMIAYWNRETSKVNIPAEIEGLPVTEIRERAFWDYGYLEGELTEITFPNSLKIIGNQSLCDTEISTIIIPENVEIILGCAFQGCNNLTSVFIPGNVKEVCYGAFNNCENLKSITFDNGVKEIAMWSLTGCPKLSSITIKDPECDIYDDMLSDDFTGTIYGYPDSTAQKYAEQFGYKFEIISDKNLGDLDGDGAVNALDASLVLMEYAAKATGKDPVLTSQQKLIADINNDGNIDALDASDILRYYAYTATGGVGSIEEYLNK